MKQFKINTKSVDIDTVFLNFIVISTNRYSFSPGNLPLFLEQVDFKPNWIDGHA